jgi:hypothetical protein
MEFGEQRGRMLRIPEADAEHVGLLVNGVHVFLSIYAGMRTW